MIVTSADTMLTEATRFGSRVASRASGATGPGVGNGVMAAIMAITVIVGRARAVPTVTIGPSGWTAARCSPWVRWRPWRRCRKRRPQ